MALTIQEFQAAEAEQQRKAEEEKRDADRKAKLKQWLEEQEAAKQEEAIQEPGMWNGIKRAGNALLEAPQRIIDSAQTEGIPLLLEGSNEQSEDSLLKLESATLALKALTPWVGPDGKWTPEGKAWVNGGAEGQRSEELMAAFTNPDFRDMMKTLDEGGSLNDEIKKRQGIIQKELDKAKNTVYINSIKKPEDAAALKKMLETKGLSFSEAWDVMSSPEAGVDIMADTVFPSLMIGAAGTVGGLLGSLTPVGPRGGATIGAGLMSATMETRRAFLSNVIDLGVNVYDAEEVMNFVLHNPTAISEAYDSAQIQGGMVGTFDASAYLMGGQVMKMVPGVKEGIKATADKLAGRVATTAADVLKPKLQHLALATVGEAAVQGTLGAAGAGFGAAAAGKEVSADEMFLEFYGEAISGLGIEAPIGIASDIISSAKEKRAEKNRIEEAAAKTKDFINQGTKTDWKEGDTLAGENGFNTKLTKAQAAELNANGRTTLTTATERVLMKEQAADEAEHDPDDPATMTPAEVADLERDVAADAATGEPSDPDVMVEQLRVEKAKADLKIKEKREKDTARLEKVKAEQEAAKAAKKAAIEGTAMPTPEGTTPAAEQATPLDAEVSALAAAPGTPADPNTPIESEAPAKRGRGRPKKVQQVTAASTEEALKLGRVEAGLSGDTTSADIDAAAASNVEKILAAAPPSPVQGQGTQAAATVPTPIEEVPASTPAKGGKGKTAAAPVVAPAITPPKVTVVKGEDYAEESKKKGKAKDKAKAVAAPTETVEKTPMPANVTKEQLVEAEAWLASPAITAKNQEGLLRAAGVVPRIDPKTGEHDFTPEEAVQVATWVAQRMNTKELDDAVQGKVDNVDPDDEVATLENEEFFEDVDADVEKKQKKQAATEREIEDELATTALELGSRMKRTRSEERAKRKAAPPKTPKEVGMAAGRWMDVDATMKGLMEKLNLAIWSSKSRRHISHKDASGVAGTSKTKEWRFEGYDVDTNTYLLVQRGLNEDGTHAMKDGADVYSAYEVNFDAGTIELVDRQGIRSVRGETLKTNLSGTSIPDIIFAGWKDLNGEVESGVVIVETPRSATDVEDEASGAYDKAVAHSKVVRTLEGKLAAVDLAIRDARRKILAAWKADPKNPKIRGANGKVLNFSKFRQDLKDLRHKAHNLAARVYLAQREEQTPEAAAEAARGAQAKTIALFEEENRKNGVTDWVRVEGSIPQRIEDRGVVIPAYMTREEYDNLTNSDARSGIAIQFLADGSTRAVRLSVPPVKIDETTKKPIPPEHNQYVASIEGVSYGKLKARVEIGKSGFAFDQRKISTLAAKEKAAKAEEAAKNRQGSREQGPSGALPEKGKKEAKKRIGASTVEQGVVAKARAEKDLADLRMKEELLFLAKHHMLEERIASDMEEQEAEQEADLVDDEEQYLKNRFEETDADSPEMEADRQAALAEKKEEALQKKRVALSSYFSAAEIQDAKDLAENFPEELDQRLADVQTAMSKQREIIRRVSPGRSHDTGSKSEKIEASPGYFDETTYKMMPGPDGKPTLMPIVTSYGSYTDPLTGETIQFDDKKARHWVTPEEYPFVYRKEHKQGLAHEAAHQKQKRLEQRKAYAQRIMDTLRPSTDEMSMLYNLRMSLSQLTASEIQALLDEKQLRRVAAALGVPTDLRSDIMAQQINTVSVALRDEVQEAASKAKAETATEGYKPEKETLTPPVQAKDIAAPALAAAKVRVLTPEGRAILNIGYLLELQDALQRKGFSQAMINATLRQALALTNDNRNVEAARASEEVRAIVTKQEEAAKQSLTIEESVQVMNTVQEAKDPTTDFGMKIKNAVANIEGLSADQLKGATKYFPGVTEFANTPAFLQGETAAPTENAQQLEGLRAEIEQLKSMGAEAGRKPEGTLSLQEDVDKMTNRGLKREFASGNVIVTKAKMDELKAFLAKKAGTLKSGVDPEEMKAVVLLTTGYVEAGIRAAVDGTYKFAQFSAQLYRDIGEMLADRYAPHLRKIWEDIRKEGKFPGMEVLNPDPDPPLTKEEIAAEKVEQEVPTPDPKMDGAANIDGETLRQEEAALEGTPESKLEAALSGLQKVASKFAVSSANQWNNINVNLGKWSPASLFNSPLVRGAGAITRRVWKQITSSSSTLPNVTAPAGAMGTSVTRPTPFGSQSTVVTRINKSMRSAADYINRAKALVNGATVTMKQFRGKYIAALEKNGIKPGSKEHDSMNKAVTDYIESGMRASSILKRHGVKIPQDIIDLLAVYVPAKDRLSQIAKILDAVPSTTKHAIDKNGAGYLHKSFRVSAFIVQMARDLSARIRSGFQDPGKTAVEVIREKDPDLMTKILNSAHLAYGLPTQPADFAHMSTASLKRLIGGKNSLYPAERSSSSDQKYVLGVVPRRHKKTGQPIIDKTTGKVKTREVLVSRNSNKEATRDEIIDYLIAHQPSQTQIDNYVKTTINNIFSPAENSALSVADLGGSSINRKRTLMASQKQQILNLIKAINKSPTVDPAIKAAMRAQKDALATFSREEFVQMLNDKTLFDDATRAVAQRSEAEFELYDAVRAGLDEVSDPAVLMMDTTTRLMSAIELTKAMSDIIELGRATGELVVGADNVEEGKHTYALGVDGKIVQGGKQGLIAGFKDLRYMTPEGGGNVIEGGHPTIYGTKDTITALHNLLNAHASTGNHAMMSFMYAMSSLAKYDKVVFNPLAHPRNAVGTMLIGLSRGVIGRFNPLISAFYDDSEFVRGSKLALNDLRSAAGLGGAVASSKYLASRPVLESIEKELADRLITHDSVRMGSLADLFSHYQTLSPNDFITALSADTRMAVTNLANDVIGNISNVAETSFRLEDEAIKGVAFLQRTKQFLNILDESGPDMRDSDRNKRNGKLMQDYFDPAAKDSLSASDLAKVQLAMDMAQENVLNTFPTFSRASDAIKSLSRNPIIGAFPTFQYEMIRTTIQQAAFSVNLMRGHLPGGVRVTGATAAKAKSLGIGLMLQQLAMQGTSLAGLAMLNSMAIATMSKGKDAKDEEDEKQNAAVAAGAVLLDAIGNNLDNYNNYMFRNLLGAFNKDAAIAVVPWTLDEGDGTFQYISLGWTVPEGTWIEGAYGLTNDILRIMDSNEYGNKSNIKLANQIIMSMVIRMAGPFINEEVLFREFSKAFTEDDSAEYDTIQNPRGLAARAINQGFRSFFEFNPDDRGFWGDHPTNTGFDVRAFAAGLAAVTTNVPPGTMAAQLHKAITAGLDTWEMSANPAAFAAQGIADMASVSLGARIVTYDYNKDYPKTLMFSQIPVLTRQSEHIRNTIFALDEDGVPETEFSSREEFERTYDALEKYRHQDYENIRNGLEMGRKLGVGENGSTINPGNTKIEDVWATANRGNKDAKVEGMDLDDFMYGTYTPTELSDAQEEKYKKQWEKANRLNEFYARLDMMKSAAASHF